MLITPSTLRVVVVIVALAGGVCVRIFVVTVAEPCGEPSCSLKNLSACSSDQIVAVGGALPEEEFTINSAKLVELRPSKIDRLTTWLNDLLNFFTITHSFQGGKIHLRITSNMPYIYSNLQNVQSLDCHILPITWVLNADRIANFVVSLQAYFALCNKKDEKSFRGRSQ